MFPEYRDIRRRLGEPLWFDLHGVPRYDPFHPDLLGVYDDMAALVEVECQACGRRLLVGVGLHSLWWRATGREIVMPSVDGPGSFVPCDSDAPPHESPDGQWCAGSTMTAVATRVVEFWRKDGVGDWHREPEFEVEFRSGDDAVA